MTTISQRFSVQEEQRDNILKGLSSAFDKIQTTNQERDSNHEEVLEGLTVRMRDMYKEMQCEQPVS